MIDENTDAYNEGKALLSKIEPLMPLLNTYVKFRDGSIAKLPGFDSAQAWFAGKVAPLAERMGLTIPADVTDFPAYVQNMVAEGQAMLKQYEDGLAELEAGKALVDEYTMVCYKNEPIYRHNGEMAVPGPEKRLGIITAVLTVGCNIFGLLTRYHGYTYPLKDGSYSGTLQLIAIITFALVSVVFLIVTAAAKNEAAKQARIEA